MSIVTRQDVDPVQQGALSGWITAEVDAPEFGESATAFVRELSSAEKEHVSFSVIGRDGEVDYTLAKGKNDLIVAYGWIDGDGKRLYVTKNDIKLVGSLPGTLIDRLSNKISDLSGLKADDVHDEIVCPNCEKPFDANLTQLLKDASEKPEPAKN